MLLAHVVLLGHEWVVEGGLADGAKAVWVAVVVVVIVVVAAAARRRHSDHIFCRFLLGLNRWCSLEGDC